MKKTLLSLGMITAVAAVVVGATGAFYSDTETSTGNTFTAGAIDLTVDSFAHYAGLICIDGKWEDDEDDIYGPVTRPELIGEDCEGTWEATDLGPRNQFFNYDDVKPGDQGENTISLHVDTNDAWMCADLTVTSNVNGGEGDNLAIASSESIDFEPGTYTLGNINGQDGWSKTGGFDVEVVDDPVIDGSQSLRISNAVTSGSFGDQTIAPELASAAGESSIASENHYEAQFQISSTKLDEQPGLFLSVSPDDGNGSRMSYLSFADEAGGIHVTFYDVTDAGPYPTVASFDSTDLGLISHGTHTIKFVIDFVDGPGNDIVKIYIDGSLVHTGTSWEDYYRYDPEQTGNGNQLFPIDTLLFRVSGPAAPGTAGAGYLIDNVSLSTGAVSSDGQLADGIEFLAWVDNNDDEGTPGDNIHQEGEEILFGPAPLGYGNGPTTLPLADSQHGAPFSPDETHYIGLAWCAGGMHINGSTGEITCDGAAMGNETQQDSMTADVVFRAEQSRNNGNFLCSGNDDSNENNQEIVTEDDLAFSFDAIASNPNSWFFYNDTNDTVMSIDEFAGTDGENHMEGIAGSGAAKMTLHSDPSNPRYNIATAQYGGVALSDISSLKYRIYDASASSETPFLNFNVDFDGSNTWQRRLVMVPTVAAGNDGVPADTWTTVDAIDGGSAMWTWSGYAANGNKWPDNNTDEYRSWSDLLAAFPNIQTLATGAWLGVRVGHPGPAGETGYVDWIEFDGQVSDFE